MSSSHMAVRMTVAASKEILSHPECHWTRLLATLLWEPRPETHDDNTVFSESLSQIRRFAELETTASTGNDDYFQHLRNALETIDAGAGDAENTYRVLANAFRRAERRMF